MEWVRQRRSELMPLTGLMVMKQSRKYHEKLNIEGECEYSEGLLQFYLMFYLFKNYLFGEFKNPRARPPMAM